ncbi:unnamed protein product [Cyclocybe aegerita]|uniref:Tryptophan dimethylallyltransferase n=1 Tax=Cyclocybe aegerita TaxID=1973307 RepID=A0A8S0WAP1_CYCAE|nr:unnamed protein product [Cyclocybe aegerita]
MSVAWERLIDHIPQALHPVTLQFQQQRRQVFEETQQDFWYTATSPILSRFLSYSGCTQQQQEEFLSFYYASITPLLGLSPQQFSQRGMKPLSFLSDDHTPVEFIWVIEGDGTSSIRFAMDTLAHDGTPLPAKHCQQMLQSLRKVGCVKSFDSTWTDVCHETLLCSSSTASTSQFFFGGDFAPTGMVGKVYYLPHARAQITGESEDQLVTECMARLGLSVGWNAVLSYMSSLPAETRPSTEMVSVDCLESSRNRLKVYFRARDRTLSGIEQHMTLGGALDGEAVQNTLRVVRNLWGFLFPGVGRDQPLSPRADKAFLPGFLIYYEMKLGNPTPFPKVYIPVRQYCESDSQIIDGVSRYLASLNISVRRDYASEVKRLL